MAVTQEDKGLPSAMTSVGPVMEPAIEAAAGIAVVVLTILGLADVSPGALAAIATIVIGAGLLMQVADAGTEYARLTSRSDAAPLSSAMFGGGAMVSFLAGGVGIVLGILALLGVSPMHLTPAALIVFGGALLLSAGVTAEMNRARIRASNDSAAARAVAEQAATAAAGAQALIGLAAIILGILALVPTHATILVLVGLLAVGASLLLTAAATAGAAMGELAA
jgi:uncharacterized membrane protein YkgB